MFRKMYDSEGTFIGYFLEGAKPNGELHLSLLDSVELLEIKHGHWISDEDGNISCSVCGQHGVGDDYCEKCGTKMDGRKE